jgi:hypothetical protein
LELLATCAPRLNRPDGTETGGAMPARDFIAANLSGIGGSLRLVVGFEGDIGGASTCL